MAADFSGRMNYVEVQQLFDELMPAGDFRCYWKARYLSELPDEMIDRAMADAAAAPSANSLSSLWNFGGAVSHVPADETAFGDRSMGWMYSLDAVWSDSRKMPRTSRGHEQVGKNRLNGITKDAFI
ncbi:hypothetical protein [Sulfitobacter sediminilitoris]|uniref:hypothetical protein n=1 Tax=Sulfitobacter sediminilitoris TaxID=2698830 RepID=UPI0036192CD5